MVFLIPDALRFHPGQHHTIDFCEIAEIKKAAAIADSPGSSCYPQKGNAAGWSLSIGIPAATAAKTARNLSFLAVFRGYLTLVRQPLYFC